MCGICGYIDFKKKKINKKIVYQMNQSLYKRGPDSAGYYFYKNIGIGMRRLSIIDIKKGNQPISDHSQNIHLTLNGEIYNYLELRKELELKGCKFETNSDTEVIIHLYSLYGKECIKFLNGMFAFSLYDIRKKELWIARDRLGIKPLYFSYNKNFFIFSSSCRSLLKSNLIKKKINQESQLSYFLLNYIPGNMCIWKGIKKLKPGHYLTIKNNKITIKQYWSIKNKKKIKKNLEINDLLEKAVEINTRSDVKVGAMLSGGLDSSYISNVYAKYYKRKLFTFTVDFENKKNNENYIAQNIAKKIKASHTRIFLTRKKAFKLLNEVIKNYDEPIADTGVVSTYAVSKIAKKKNIKVLLSGAGGDEVFGGYKRYFLGNRDIMANIFYFLKPILRELSKKSIYCYNLFSLLFNKPISYIQSISGVNLALYKSIINNEFLYSKVTKIIEKKFVDINKPDKSNETFGFKRMKIDIENYLVDNILTLTDQSSMACSVEVRVPFLDHNILEKLFFGKKNINIGTSAQNSKKYLYEIIKNKFPILKHRVEKTGFNAPILEWMNSEKKNTWNYVYKHKEYIKNIFNIRKLKKEWFNNDKKKNNENFYSIYLYLKWINSYE